MKTMSKVLSLAMVVGLIAAIPAGAQMFGRADAGSFEENNLPLLIAVNRMELTAEQMEEIHGILAGLLEERAQIEATRSEFEEEMVAFSGTAEELAEILETFRTEAGEQAAALQAAVSAAVDEIKDILTVNQWEALGETFPGLLADRAATARPGQVAWMSRGRIAPAAPLARRAQHAPGMAERRAEDAEALEDLRSRMEAKSGERTESMVERMEERMADRSQDLRTLGDRFTGRFDAMTGRFGLQDEAAALGGAFGMGFLPGQGMIHAAGPRLANRVWTGGFELIEQWVEVLELKLQAVE